MPWTLVGEKSFETVNGAGTDTITLPGTPAIDDIVAIIQGADIGIPSIVTSGYTTLNFTSDVSNAIGSRFSYKLLTAADTDVEVNQVSTHIAGIIQVWRGADTTTPLDNGVGSENIGGSSSYPDPSAHSVVTLGALRLIAGALDDDNDAANAAAPSGYTNFLAADVDPESSGVTVMIASKVAMAIGSEDPGAFTGSATDTSVGYHTAFRPAVPLALGGAALIGL